MVSQRSHQTPRKSPIKELMQGGLVQRTKGGVRALRNASWLFAWVRDVASSIHGSPNTKTKL